MKGALKVCEGQVMVLHSEKGDEGGRVCDGQHHCRHVTYEADET
jgi:hypothetical protein